MELSDMMELAEYGLRDGSTLTLVRSPYDLRSARTHVRRLRELLRHPPAAPQPSSAGAGEPQVDDAGPASAGAAPPQAAAASPVARRGDLQEKTDLQKTAAPQLLGGGSAATDEEKQSQTSEEAERQRSVRSLVVSMDGWVGPVVVLRLGQWSGWLALARSTHAQHRCVSLSAQRLLFETHQRLERHRQAMERTVAMRMPPLEEGKAMARATNAATQEAHHEDTSLPSYAQLEEMEKPPAPADPAFSADARFKFHVGVGSGVGLEAFYPKVHHQWREQAVAAQPACAVAVPWSSALDRCRKPNRVQR